MISLVSWFNFKYDIMTVDSGKNFIPESFCLHVLCPISCCSRVLLCASALFLTYLLLEIKEPTRTIEPQFGSWWFWKLFYVFHLQLNGFTDSIGTTVNPTAAWASLCVQPIRNVQRWSPKDPEPLESTTCLHGVLHCSWWKFLQWKSKCRVLTRTILF